MAQVPIGIAGPLLIHGEHAQGEFYVPLATTEGSLVSSYNRGMRLLTECGGVKTTVVDDAMQRAPVFIFGDALQAREFGRWVEEHLCRDSAGGGSYDTHRQVAGHQPVCGRSIALSPLQLHDRAMPPGQNMSGKATFAACEWIKNNHPLHPDYLLTGNIDTDKKHSQMNMLLGRGKRVVAEAVFAAKSCSELMHITAADLDSISRYPMAGAFLAGSSNNGAHSANALAALFIATGQDVANVAEAHAAITYTRVLANGDFYWSITLPALIVATYGGGTGLATQKECLEMLGCYGKGKVHKFAEICAAVVLAGETSLASAILHGDWVTAHEKFGRNRP